MSCQVWHACGAVWVCSAPWWPPLERVCALDATHAHGPAGTRPTHLPELAISAVVAPAHPRLPFEPRGVRKAQSLEHRQVELGEDLHGCLPQHSGIERRHLRECAPSPSPSRAWRRARSPQRSQARARATREHAGNVRRQHASVPGAMARKRSKRYSITHMVSRALYAHDGEAQRPARGLAATPAVERVPAELPLLRGTQVMLLEQTRRRRPRVASGCLLLRAVAIIVFLDPRPVAFERARGRL